MMATTAELPPGTIHVPLRAAGVSLAASGLLLAASTPLHPDILDGRDLAGIVQATSTWTAVHAAWLVSSLLDILGAAGIVAAHRGRLGRAGQAGLAITIVGATATAYLMFLELVAFPPVARDAPQLLADLFDVHGPLFGTPLALALTALAGGLPAGFVVLGLAAARCGIQARAGVALTAGTMAFEVFAVGFVPVLGVVSAVAFGAVLAWWGLLLWREGQSAVAQRSVCSSAASAACIPHMPWTPPPGGVDEEQRYSRGFGVR
jgi:hypothetical protein